MRTRSHLLLTLILGASLTLVPLAGAEAGDGPALSGADTDGDGIDDAVDRCPETAGSLDYKGCPSPKDLGLQDDAASTDAPVDRAATGDTSSADDSDDDADDDDGDGALGTGAATMATIGGITMGIGALAVLVSGGLWIACGATRNDVNYAAQDDDGIITGITQREARDQLELADELETSAAVTASVGAGLFATGLVLLLVSAAMGVGEAVTESEPTFVVAPGLTPDGGSVDLTIRF